MSALICSMGHSGSRTNACERRAKAGDEYCAQHRRSVDQFDAIAAAMPDEISVDDEPID